MKWQDAVTWKKSLFIASGLMIILVLALKFQGHISICECGEIKLWHGALNTPEDSQHLSDWYTFSHIIHGFAFYWAIRVFSKKRISVPFAFLLSVLLEVGWEILENSPIIINRYRETASLMYFGDSIVNSVSDVLAMVIGFICASRVRTYVSVLAVIGLELFTLYMIKDNLALNIIMLIHPFEAIKNWQLGI